MTFQNLRPLPMRITQRQYDRLTAHRARDHISIQEHVRRALDNYLDLLDRKSLRELAMEAPSTASGSLESPQTPPIAEKPQSGSVPPVGANRQVGSTVRKSTQPKLVYR